MYQGVINVSFSENSANILNESPPGQFSLVLIALTLRYNCKKIVLDSSFLMFLVRGR